MRIAPQATPFLGRLITYALLTAAVAVLAYHLALECATLGLPEPMGYPEVVYRGIARVWPHQYQLGHFVDAQDNYGPGYSTFCRPFLALGMDPYVAARAANLAALSGASLILLGVLRSYRISGALSLAVTALFFALNAGSSSLQARPDFLESLLILALLAAGRPSFLECRGTLSAALLIGLLGLGAFLTKPYGLLAWGTAAAYPFVSGGVVRFSRRSLAIAAISSGVIVLGIAAYASANPYFLTETVVFHFVHRDPGSGAFLLQLRDFSGLACGLVATAAAGLVLGRRKPGAPGWISDPERGYWVFALALGAAALGLGLGWHRGAYLTYYYHLLLPPLAVVAAFACESIEPSVAAIALTANCALLVALAPALPKPDPEWERLAHDLALQKGPVVVDFMLEPLAAGRLDARVAGNGINRFALDLPDRVGGLRSAREEVVAYVQSEREVIRKGPPPEAIYMDCYLFAKRPGDPRVADGGYLAVPRNEHPLLLNGYDMDHYVPVGLFVLHPFYGSQNSPRQQAGTWIMTVVKFVRLGRGHDPSPAERLPFALVAPAG